MINASFSCERWDGQLGVLSIFNCFFPQKNVDLSALHVTASLSNVRFALKVRILRVLQHSNVVYVHQFFKKDPKYYYVVMEHMAGGELFDRIVQKVPLL